jgi:hypothetical protein
MRIERHDRADNFGFPKVTHRKSPAESAGLLLVSVALVDSEPARYRMMPTQQPLEQYVPPGQVPSVAHAW